MRIKIHALSATLGLLPVSFGVSVALLWLVERKP